MVIKVKRFKLFKDGQPIKPLIPWIQEKSQIKKINLRKRNEVDKRRKPISFHYTTVNNYFKQYFGKHRKIRKVFLCLMNIERKESNFAKGFLE